MCHESNTGMGQNNKICVKAEIRRTRVATELLSLCSRLITPDVRAPTNNIKVKLIISKKLRPLPNLNPVCANKIPITIIPVNTCNNRQTSNCPNLSSLLVLLRNEINKPNENKVKIEKPEICLNNSFRHNISQCQSCCTDEA